MSNKITLKDFSEEVLSCTDLELIQKVNISAVVTDINHNDDDRNEKTSLSIELDEEIEIKMQLRTTPKKLFAFAVGLTLLMLNKLTPELISQILLIFQ